MRTIVIAGLLGAAFAGAVQGAERREHGAHVHGLANMNVAVDGAALEIELVAPAANIVGFEHRPRSAEQRQALADALAQLQRGEEVFVLTPAAACRLEHAGAASSQEAHGHGHGHSHNDESHAHAEFTAEYRFLCERPERLSAIDVRLFELFPGNESVQVQLLTPQQQTALRLDARRSEIRL